MGFLGSILNIGTNLFGAIGNAIEGVTELAGSVNEKLECEKDAKAKNTKIGDEKTTERMVAEEMGDVQMLVALDKEDKIEIQAKKDEEQKAQAEQEKENNKSFIQNIIGQVESKSTLSLEDLVNQVSNSDKDIKNEITKFYEMTQNFLSDTKTNTGAAEGIKSITAELTKVNEDIAKIREDMKKEEDKDSNFSLETMFEKLNIKNPLTVGTDNKNQEENTKTLVA